MDCDVRGLTLHIQEYSEKQSLDFLPSHTLDLNLIYGVHVTLAPPEGWWIITRALGSECLMPAVPAAKSKLPMLAAWPTHQVEMGFKMYCMVS